MFDVAYEAEAAIETAKKLKEKKWNEVLALDLSVPLAGFAQMLTIEQLNSIIHFYEFIYNTHGGI